MPVRKLESVPQTPLSLAGDTISHLRLAGRLRAFIFVALSLCCSLLSPSFSRTIFVGPIPNFCTCNTLLVAIFSLEFCGFRLRPSVPKPDHVLSLTSGRLTSSTRLESLNIINTRKTP